MSIIEKTLKAEFELRLQTVEVSFDQSCELSDAMSDLREVTDLLDRYNSNPDRSNNPFDLYELELIMGWASNHKA